MMSKNMCFKRRDELAPTDTPAVLTTTTTTQHVTGAPDQQSLATAQVGKVFWYFLDRPGEPS